MILLNILSIEAHYSVQSRMEKKRKTNLFFRPLLEQVYACAECGWPACSLECTGLKIPQVHGLECQILKLRLPKQNESNYEFFR